MRPNAPEAMLRFGTPKFTRLNGVERLEPEFEVQAPAHAIEHDALDQRDVGVHQARAAERVARRAAELTGRGALVGRLVEPLSAVLRAGIGIAHQVGPARRGVAAGAQARVGAVEDVVGEPALERPMLVTVQPPSTWDIAPA